MQQSNPVMKAAGQRRDVADSAVCVFSINQAGTVSCHIAAAASS
jgi:hypothetical protein